MSPSPPSIVRRPLYETARDLFTREQYDAARVEFTHGLQHWPDLDSFDHAILWGRIANCHAGAVRLDPTTLDAHYPPFLTALDHYFTALQQTLRHQPDRLNSRHDCETLLREAITLHHHHATDFAAHCHTTASAFAELAWFGRGRTLAVVLAEAFQWRAQLHYHHAYDLARLYLELAHAPDSVETPQWAAVYNLLSDLEYFIRGHEAEEAALEWIYRTLELAPTDPFALKQRKYLEERQVVMSQIRRFNHDTHTAIGSLKTSLTALRRDPELPPRLQQRTVQMWADLQRIDDVNRLIQKQAPRFDALNLIDWLPEQLRPYADRLTVAWQLPDRPRLDYEIDSGYLAIALNHLIQNSLEAYERHATPHAARTLLVTLAITDCDYTLTLTDRAGGVDPQLQERIFEPYISSKGIQKQTGLGLYQSRHIVEDMLHGTLRLADTQPAGGAAFELHLPQNAL